VFQGERHDGSTSCGAGVFLGVIFCLIAPHGAKEILREKSFFLLSAIDSGNGRKGNITPLFPTTI
jgi:hypothetical protein